MSALLVLILSGSFGWLSVRFGWLDRKSALHLNRFIIFVSLPALTLVNVYRLEFGRDSILAASTPWLLFVSCTSLVLAAAKYMRFNAKTTGALILTAGLGNTSFIGFPLVEAYFGSEGLQTAIFVDQPGTFLILAFLGVPIAVRFSGGQAVKFTQLIKRVITFPPFIALLVALALRPIKLPDELLRVLTMVGATLAPIALLSVGIQSYGSTSGWREERRALSFGLFLKLVFSPILVYLIYVKGLGATGVAGQVMVLEAAMAPMITSSILAAERGLNPRLCGLMLAVGIPLSLITTGIWYYVLLLLAPAG